MHAATALLGDRCTLVEKIKEKSLRVRRVGRSTGVSWRCARPWREIRAAIKAAPCTGIWPDALPL
eukprot:2808171-Pleurochrysis_carterae.AAC.1